MSDLPPGLRGEPRYCLRPGCHASFSIVDVFAGRASAPGWTHNVSVVYGYLCPGHAGPWRDRTHLPRWLTPESVAVRSTCGTWQWHPATAVTCQDHYAARPVGISTRGSADA